MGTEVPTSKLREQIMRKRGLIPPKQKRVDAYADQPEEDLTLIENVPLLPKMKYIEAKYGVKVRLDIFQGSLNEVVRRYNWEIDRSTVSRWRKYMRQYIVQVVQS